MRYVTVSFYVNTIIVVVVIDIGNAGGGDAAVRFEPLIIINHYYDHVLCYVMCSRRYRSTSAPLKQLAYTQRLPCPRNVATRRTTASFVGPINRGRSGCRTRHCTVIRS